MLQQSKKLRAALPVVLLAVLPACGYLFGDQGVFRDNADDYKKAPELEVIKVPEGKNTEALREIYAIPDIEESVVIVGEFEVPRPSPLVAGANDEMVRIQKLGEDSWALVAVAPGQLWPQVRSFLSATGLQVGRIDARSGIMETGWVQLDSKPMATRFQFRIERGVQRGTSELHVLQMNQVGDISSWPESSDDPEQETDMLRGVAQYVANSADTAPVSMIADQSISSSGKVSLQESPSGYTYIALDLSFKRAWASLGRALTASSFEITDRDRSSGTYYARFIGADGEEEDGWFDWLFDSDEEHPLAGQDFIITVTADGETAVSIRLQSADETVQLEKREEQSLLALIKSNIT
jgi:outer membrane protein assembly factor BamC